MTDVKVAVWFRWETGHQLLGRAATEVAANLIADEIPRFGVGFSCRVLSHNKSSFQMHTVNGSYAGSLSLSPLAADCLVFTKMLSDTAGHKVSAKDNAKDNLGKTI